MLVGSRQQIICAGRALARTRAVYIFRRQRRDSGMGQRPPRTGPGHLARRPVARRPRRPADHPRLQRQDARVPLQPRAHDASDVGQHQ